MNKSIKVIVWNREFDLDIIYQQYSGEEATDLQINVADSLAEIDFNLNLKEVTDYIINQYGAEIGTDEITNVFRYVMPKRIFITRSEKRIFAIVCNFKLDMEHGIAIVYEDGKFKEVGPLDIIL